MVSDELVFSRAWEDDRLDLEALAIRPGERVLVIAAAGDAALAAASEGAARVIAVDSNPAQLSLLALKIAAAQSLDADARYRLFEVGRLPEGPQVYRERLRWSLGLEAAAFWDRRLHLLGNGLHDGIGVGRAFGRLGRLARFLVPSLEIEIERATSPNEQLAFWTAHVQGRLFGPITHWLFTHTPLLRPLVPNGLELQQMRRGYSHALQHRVETIVGRELIREHPWWRPAFSGRAVELGHGAAWLDPDREAAVASGATRIELVRGDLIEVLRAQPAGSLDAVSVSNVVDWLPPTARAELGDALVRALSPDGRVLARSILEVEPFSGDGLVRDPRSEDLVDRERTALYGRVELLRRR